MEDFSLKPKEKAAFIIKKVKFYKDILWDNGLTVSKRKKLDSTLTL